MNETAQAIKSALDLFEKFEGFVRYLDPELSDEEVYQATKRLMGGALGIQRENDKEQ